MLLAHQDVALRVSSFALEDKWLFWSRVRLYADRLELVGWSLTGRYRRVIRLEHIEEVDTTGDDLVLEFKDRSFLRMGIDGPEQWASAIEIYRDIRKVCK